VRTRRSGILRVRVRDGGDLLSARWKSTAREDPTGGVVGLGGEQVICFEDIVIGECMTSSAIVVDRDELVDFASVGTHFRSTSMASCGQPRRTDRTGRVHLSQAASHSRTPEHAVIASFGYDECASIIRSARVTRSAFGSSTWIRDVLRPNRIEAS
jgi:hypothetical protein